VEASRYRIIKSGSSVTVQIKGLFFYKTVSEKHYFDIWGCGDASYDSMPINFGSIKNAHDYIKSLVRREWFI